jgi:uncharacterized membrane protein
MALYARRFLFAGLIMLALDAVWLTLAVDVLYRPRIGHLMRPDGFDAVAAAAFYVLYLAGVLVLALAPSRDWRGAAWRGAAYGLCAYGTYDLTNQATLRDWPWLVTFVDLGWGMALTAAVAGGAFLLAGRDKAGRDKEGPVG